MKNTLIIIKCENGLVFSQIAKAKILETKIIKNLDYNLLLNPVVIEPKIICEYQKIYIIGQKQFFKMFKNNKKITKILINDFIANPDKY